MLIENDKELLKLKDDAYKARIEYNKASEKLRKGYFYEIDSEIKAFEDKKKEEFLNKVGKNIAGTFIDFKFNYDPFNMTLCAKVKYMKINEIDHDLGSIALSYPEEKKTHDMLITISKEYRQTRDGMESELVELGLHPSARPCAIKNIEKFLADNNLFGFVPELY